MILRLNFAMRELIDLSILHSLAMAHRLGVNSTDLESLDSISTGRAHTPGDLMEQTGLTSGAITA